MSSRSFKPNFEAYGEAARLQSAKLFQENFKLTISLSTISNRAISASQSWVHPEGASGYPWQEIKNLHRQPDRLEVAVWSGGRLCGLAIAVTKNSVLEICFIEGDPSPGNPTKGAVAMIVLDCAARYAQKRGRSQLRLKPANNRVAELYKTTYGFYVDEKDPKPSDGSEPFLRKEVQR